MVRLNKATKRHSLQKCEEAFAILLIDIRDVLNEEQLLETVAKYCVITRRTYQVILEPVSLSHYAFWKWLKIKSQAVYITK